MLVDERDGGAVDLGLDHVGDGLVGAEALADVGLPLLECVLVVVTFSSDPIGARCSTLRSPSDGAAPTRSRRRIGGDELGVSGLERLRARRRGRRSRRRRSRVVEDVIAVRVVLDEPPQLLGPALRDHRRGVRQVRGSPPGAWTSASGSSASKPLVGMDATPADGDRQRAGGLAGPDVERRVSDVDRLVRVGRRAGAAPPARGRGRACGAPCPRHPRARRSMPRGAGKRSKASCTVATRFAVTIPSRWPRRRSSGRSSRTPANVSSVA